MTKNITNIIISAILMLALSHCDNRQQPEQTEKEKNMASVTSVSASELIADSIIASELRMLKKQLEHDYYRLYLNLRLPYCEQCSDLEFILISERILGNDGIMPNPYRSYRVFYDPVPTNITSAVYPTKKNKAAIKRRLSVLKTQYKERFGLSAPWWWICSADEHIKRLEAAIKTNKKYPHYPVEDSAYYQMGKTMAAYEMWFKRPFPNCTKKSCSEQKHLEHAEQALDAGLPYLSEKEDLKLKNKLKAMYKKMFGVPIPDYWLSVTRIYSFRRPYGNFSYIFITRTADGGAIAKEVRKNVHGSIYYSLNLSMKDWLNFINTLDKFNVNTWEKKRLLPSSRRHYEGNLMVFTLNSEKDSTSGYCVGNIEIDDYCVPPHISQNYRKVIEDTKAKIQKYGKTNYDK